MIAVNTMAKEHNTELSDDGHKYVLCKLLETVLHPSIEYLNISIWPRSLAAVLWTNLKQLTGLRVCTDFLRLNLFDASI